MNNDRIEGNWKELKGKIKEQYGKLTDKELTEAEGSAEKLAVNLQAKYGYAKDEAKKKADKFFK